MKKMSLLLFVLCAIAGMMAQSSTHNVSLVWAASPDAAANPTLSYNVYRAAVKCPTDGSLPSGIAKIANVPTPGYLDTAVSVGASYCYTITATLNGGESAPSNTAGGTIPIAAPGSLVITIK